MKRIIVSLSFLILVIPLAIIGFLDYQISKYNIHYKNRKILLTKAIVEFKDISANVNSIKIRAPKVIARFNLLSPLSLNLSANTLYVSGINTEDNKIILKSVFLELSDFYRSYILKTKRISASAYSLALQNLKVAKKKSEIKGEFQVDSLVKTRNLFDWLNVLEAGRYIAVIGNIKFKNPIYFAIDDLNYPNFKVTTNTVEIGAIDIEEIDLKCDILKDDKYAIDLQCNFDRNSFVNLSGTISQFSPLNALLKLNIKHTKLLDSLFKDSNKNSYNIIATVAKILNITTKDHIRILTISIKNGIISTGI